jgi:hypothetical protein
VRLPSVHTVATTPAQRLAASCAHFTRRISLPRCIFTPIVDTHSGSTRMGGQVGVGIGIFYACSAFTHVTACTLAKSPRSLSDLGLIYCAGGRAAHNSPIFRSIAPPCASKSENSVLALPPCSLRSPKSDRLIDISHWAAAKQRTALSVAAILWIRKRQCVFGKYLSRPWLVLARAPRISRARPQRRRGARTREPCASIRGPGEKWGSSDPLHRRLQPLHYLHDCSGSYRLER